MSEINTGKEIHALSRNNEKLIKKSKNVGCFYCLKIYHAKDITAYRSYNGAGVCVFCKVDALIPDAAKDVELSEEFLKAMRARWFNM